MTATARPRQGDLDRIFQPASVAVAGASRDPSKRGHQAIRRLLAEGFDGDIYPVNPRAGAIAGLPAYPSLAELPGPVDLVLVATSNHLAETVIDDAGVAGAAGAVVLANGFRETGEAGAAMEARLVAAARSAGVRLIGPNTSGVYNLTTGLNLVGATDVVRGSIGLLSQSGNVALSLFVDDAHTNRTGFSVYVGVGNEADIRFHEYLAFLTTHAATGCVVVYAEGFACGLSFLEQVEWTTSQKPVVVALGGRTEAGREAARSHTGALATSGHLAPQLLRAAGAIVVERLDELLPTAQVLAANNSVSATRVSVVADGGGHGTLAADRLTDLDIHLPELSPATRRRLRDLLPPAASVRNPVDVAGATDTDPRRFGAVVEAVLADPAIDAVLLVGILGGYSRRFFPSLAELERLACEEIAASAASAGKALVVHSVYEADGSPGIEALRSAGVPVFGSVEVAATALAGRAGDGRSSSPLRASRRARSPAEQPSSERFLTEPQARAFLQRRGLDLPRSITIDVTDAPSRAVADAVAAVGGRAALKVVSPDVTHKRAVGGVALDVSPVDAAARLHQLLDDVLSAAPGVRIEGVLVTAMAPIGLELLVGGHRDPSFGPVLALGLGGSMVETARRVSFRRAPCTTHVVDGMLEELALLEPLRRPIGDSRSRQREVVALGVAISEVLHEEPSIVALDLNPVIVHDGGVSIVDVRVAVSPEHHE